MFDDARYQDMRDRGSDPTEVYLQAIQDGMTGPEATGLIARTFKLSIIAAKEVSVTASSDYKSLSDYQATLKDAIEAVLKDIDKEQTNQ